MIKPLCSPWDDDSQLFIPFVPHTCLLQKKKNIPHAVLSPTSPNNIFISLNDKEDCLSGGVGISQPNTLMFREVNPSSQSNRDKSYRERRKICRKKKPCTPDKGYPNSCAIIPQC